MADLKPTTIIEQLKSLANAEKAKEISRLFKKGYGEYASNDKFLGIAANDIKMVAKKYAKATSFTQVLRLLKSKYHEIRRAGIAVLVEKSVKSDKNLQKSADFYISNINCINSWDLVDASAQQILGKYLVDKDKIILYDFAASGNIWKQRLAITATLEFVQNGNFDDAFAISEMLIDNGNDLVTHAVARTLREIGKKNQSKLDDFLHKYPTFRIL